MLALQACCKAWNLQPFDAAWRLQYVLDFEVESLNQACVTLNDDSTFRKRYQARHAIEQNWTSNRCRGYHIQCSVKIYWSAICTPLARLLCLSHDRQLLLFDLQDGKEITRWRLSSSNSHAAATVRLDAFEQTHAAVDDGSGELSVWDISGAKQKQLACFKIERPSAVARIALAIYGESLFLLEELASETVIRVWHYPSGRLLHSHSTREKLFAVNLHPMGPSSLFVESRLCVTLVEVGPQGLYVTPSSLELPLLGFVCRADTRVSDRLLICTGNAVHAFTAGKKPTPLRSTVRHMVDHAIHFRAPRHLVSPMGSLLLVDLKMGTKHAFVAQSMRGIGTLAVDFRFLVRTDGGRTISVWDFAPPKQAPSDITRNWC